VARRRAREIVFQALFQAERGGAPLPEAWAEVQLDLAREASEEGEENALPFEEGDLLFAQTLVDTLLARKEEIDALLQGWISGWSFGQMAQTDLNILRLAVAELELRSTPPAVAVEMAVRLAKRFGGEDSGRFVNGVLAKGIRRYSRTEEG
jgi:transcription antitermination protein NusB